MITSDMITSLDNSLVAQQVQETMNCYNPDNGFIYFANKYANCVHPLHGLQKVTLYNFQEELLTHIHNRRVSVNMLPRQMGKTLCTAIYIAWRMLFLDNETIAVTGPRVRFSQDLIEKVRFIIDRCPTWLKHSVVVDNKHEIRLSNGSRVLAKSFEPNSFRGLSIDFLFVDEAGCLEERKMNDFLHAVYPVVSSTKGKIAITSSPGTDTSAFKSLWKLSQDKDTVFAGYKANWYDHPERDTRWKNSVVSHIGQEAFEREYECKF